MTITVVQLKALANEHFIQPEQVGETAVRFLRRSEDTPFAVYYFDLTTDLPRTLEELSSYQDKIIAETYFGGSKSLQWNTYLYFVPPVSRGKQPDFAQVRSLIESDRGYARKHIIFEQALPSIFNPMPEASNDAPQGNILETWSERLQSIGIDEIVWGDADMPSRLDAVEEPARKARSLARANVTAKRPPAAEMIRDLKLVDYRPYPLGRTFHFGRVNLISGVNASGKTSLLEAIELFYCGRNYRSPHNSPSFDIQATYFSGKTESTTQKTPQRLFRDRNLHWYGQHEIKTNNIAGSFAKYNFLNTDAAVELADSADNAEDDLSKLLIGPDAARIWHNITNVIASLKPRLRERERTRKQLVDERDTLRKMIAPDPKRTQSSSLLRDRLQNIVDGLGWGASDSTPMQLARRLVGPLAQTVSIVEQAIQLGYSKSETAKSLDLSRRTLRAQCRELTDLLKRWQSAEELLSQATQRRKDLRAAKTAAQKAKRILASKLIVTLAELREASAAAARYLSWFENFDRDISEQLRARFETRTLSAALKQVSDAQTNIQTQLQQRRREHAEFARLQARAVDLLDQLRDIAKQIIARQEDPDICPLCNTKLPRGGLAKHLQERGGTSAATERRLLKAVRDLEQETKTLVRDLQGLRWMEGFCTNVELPKDTPIKKILVTVDRVGDEMSGQESRIKSANRLIEDLDKSGVSIETLDEVCDDLEAYGFPLGHRRPSNADAVIARIETADQRVAEDISLQSGLRDVVRTSFARVSERSIGNLTGAQAILNELEKRHDALDQCIKRLNAALERFPWPATRPLSRFIAEAKTVEKLASDLQGKIGEEEAQRKSETEANRRLSEIDKDLNALAPRVERLKAAQTVLLDLQNNHSLTQALDDALQENRGSIEHIFRNIHSPSEFSGLGDTLKNLRRISPAEDIDLFQISTGQRAALALSIFLAQNSQLTVAPPVLLIDDPIAHIDDLNCLSFLDYLREIVLEGQRQIFFATASDKLSAVVARKFDFLGDAFCKIDLSRPATS